MKNKKLNLKKKDIKVKGKCPRCGSKMIWGSWMYVNEPHTEEFLPVCTNENCDEYYGYGNDVAYKFINHRTVKILGFWG